MKCDIPSCQNQATHTRKTFLFCKEHSLGMSEKISEWLVILRANTDRRHSKITGGPLQASERLELLFKEAKSLGLDFPSDQMLCDLIHDVEFDVLWNPVTFAKLQGQDLEVMRALWKQARVESCRAGHDFV